MRTRRETPFVLSLSKHERARHRPDATASTRPSTGRTVTAATTLAPSSPAKGPFVVSLSNHASVVIAPRRSLHSMNFFPF